MSGIGQPEWVTQKRVLVLLADELGYRYLGNWIDREGSSNIEDALLTRYLSRQGYTDAQISRAIHLLRIEADNRPAGVQPAALWCLTSPQKTGTIKK